MNPDLGCSRVDDGIESSMLKGLGEEGLYIMLNVFLKVFGGNHSMTFCGHDE